MAAVTGTTPRSDFVYENMQTENSEVFDFQFFRVAGKIRLIDGNAKCRHLEKFTRNFAAGVNLSEAQGTIPFLTGSIQCTYTRRKGRGKGGGGS
jgi:hypothetical protein